MVASSSNLLLVASSSHTGHIHTGSTIPNDHDLTSESDNRRGYMIRSTSTNHIRGSSGTNLKDMMIMLETVAPIVIASTASTAVAATSPSATKSEEKQRPRPRRKKMVSIGVDAMKKMMMTSSSNSNTVAVALPESPTMVSRKYEREQCDDIETVFNNIRSTSNRKVLAFDLSAPSMPDMMTMMPAPTLPTPALNQSSKPQNGRSNNYTTAPMNKQKKKKQIHFGRRLRTIKKRLTSNSESSKQEKGRLSPGTSVTTTSTSSLGQTVSPEADDDAPSIDTMTMMTSLKPRVRSMFQEDEEDRMMTMMPMMPLPAAPWSPSSASISTSTNEERDVVTTSSSSPFSSKLDGAVSVLSPTDDDDDYDGDGDAVADADADDWGVFASIQDDDDDDDDEEHDIRPKYHNYNYKSLSRVSCTQNTTNPCFQPRAQLPIFAATAGAE